MFACQAQHLDAYSPSPTTISYTVSTRRRPISRFLNAALHGLRGLALFYVFLINKTKAQGLALASDNYFERLLCICPASGLIRVMAEKIDWWALGIITFAVLYLCLRRGYTGTFSHATDDQR